MFSSLFSSAERAAGKHPLSLQKRITLNVETLLARALLI